MHTTFETITEILKKSIVQVVFKKTDGTERVMKCTLNEKYLKPYTKKTDREKAPNKDTISVWDLDNEGWRSFKLENVISYSFIEGEMSDQWLKLTN